MLLILLGHNSTRGLSPHLHGGAWRAERGQARGLNQAFALPHAHGRAVGLPFPLLRARVTFHLKSVSVQ